MAAARAAMAMAGAMAWLNREDGGAGGSGGGGDSVAVEANAMATAVATIVATLVAMVVARVVARAATRAAAAMAAAEGCGDEESSDGKIRGRFERARPTTAKRGDRLNLQLGLAFWGGGARIAPY